MLKQKSTRQVAQKLLLLQIHSRELRAKPPLLHRNNREDIGVTHVSSLGLFVSLVKLPSIYRYMRASYERKKDEKYRKYGGKWGKFSSLFRLKHLNNLLINRYFLKVKENAAPPFHTSLASELFTYLTLDKIPTEYNKNNNLRVKQQAIYLTNHLTNYPQLSSKTALLDTLLDRLLDKHTTQYTHLHLTHKQGDDL